MQVCYLCPASHRQDQPSYFLSALRPPTGLQNFFASQAQPTPADTHDVGPTSQRRGHAMSLVNALGITVATNH